MRQQIATKQTVIFVGLPQKRANFDTVAAHAAVVGRENADIGHIHIQPVGPRDEADLFLSHPVKRQIEYDLVGDAGYGGAGVDQ